jgi:hypothetical protein
MLMTAISIRKDEAERRGAEALLLKPFTPDELLADLRAVLEVTKRGIEREDAARFDTEREHMRAAARAMAGAAIRAGAMKEPETQKRATTVVRWLARYFEHSTVRLLLPSEDERLTVYASSEVESHVHGRAIDAIARTVLEAGSTVIIPDVADQPWLGLPPDDLGAVLCVPFRYHDTPMGALCLVTAEARDLGACDAAILEHIATQAATRFTRARLPFLGRSGLVSRNSFRRILAIEAGTASEVQNEGIALAIARMPINASLGHLLEQAPEGRTVIGELHDDAIAIAARGPHDRARDAARAGLALLEAHGAVRASAELVVGPPVPPIPENALIAWAERLLVETGDTPEHVHVVVDTQATWAPA